MYHDMEYTNLLILLNGSLFSDYFKLIINNLKCVCSIGIMEFWVSQWTRPLAQKMYLTLYRRLWPMKCFSLKHMLSTVLWELLLKAMIWGTWSILFYHIFIPGNLFNCWCPMYIPQTILGACIIQFWPLYASSLSLLNYLYYYSLFSSLGIHKRRILWWKLPS